MGIKEDFKIELGSYENALYRLKDSLEKPNDEYMRDSVIQRFEFSFELAWKVLKMYLDFLGRDRYNSPRECILAGAQVAVIAHPEDWPEYLRARNISTHVYSEDLANEVYNTAKKFIDDGFVLLNLLREKFKESKT